MTIGATWHGSQPLCLTCRFWAGQREIDAYAKTFTAQAMDGTCCGPFFSYRGLTMSDMACCSDWQAYFD